MSIGYTHTHAETWNRLPIVCWWPASLSSVKIEIMVCIYTCVSQSWAASWQGSRHLFDVFSVSDRGLSPLSQTGEENHPLALVRHSVMLLIPVGLQAFIVWWTDRWKRNNYSIRLYWQMEVTHPEKSVHELEFRMSIHMCIFPNVRAVEVLLCERSFSAGGRRVVWELSLMAQFSCWDIKSLPLLLFFCPFSNTETLTQWQLPSTRLSWIRNNKKPMFFLTLWCFAIVDAGV